MYILYLKEERTVTLTVIVNISNRIIIIFPENLTSNSNTHFTDMHISLSYLMRLKKQNTYETKIILTINMFISLNGKK